MENSKLNNIAAAAVKCDNSSKKRVATSVTVKVKNETDTMHKNLGLTEEAVNLGVLQDDNTNLLVLGNRAVNPSLLGDSPSLYAMCRAYVQNDGNKVRGSFVDQAEEIQLSSTMTRQLPHVDRAVSEG